MGRGAGKVAQLGAPTLEVAMEVYLARPKLRSKTNKTGMHAQLALHLKDWMRLPLDEISKAMVVRRHQEMAGPPSAANHVRRNFRAIYNHARRTCDLAECPTTAIEWFEDKPDGRIIDDLKDWRQTIDDLPNPIHRVFYELLLFMHRRTFATVAMEAGVLEEIEGRLLNHTPLSITGQRYTRPSLDALRPSMEVACKEILTRIDS